MPICSKDNIFNAIKGKRAEFALIFGHIGSNEMGQLWKEFAFAMDAFRHVSDPFVELEQVPVQVPNGTWLCFIPAEQNYGIGEDSLQSILSDIFTWVREKGLQSVITNGVADTDHGPVTEKNRQSDDIRAKFLIRDASVREAKYSISIELTSLNDVFTRNWLPDDTRVRKDQGN